ncbi:2-hydroxycarboxylate transporter family protein [Hoyosella subflava]|nr:2-hydroxycarboxylate transporter family protein [Hoyosella subflava]
MTTQAPDPVATSTREQSDPEASSGTGGKPPTADRRRRWPVISGMPAEYFLVLFAVIVVASLTGTLPTSLIAGFAAAIAFAGILMWIGQKVPYLRDFGLPVILCLFVPATLVYLGVMPESTIALFDAFVDEQGAMDFILIVIIVGAILGMPRKLIVKAGVRFIVPVIGTIAATLLLIGLVGAAIGYGFGRAMLLIAAPVMAGGLPIGAIPMSEMYAQAVGGTPDDFFPALLSAVLVANIVCIFAAAIFSGVGKRRGRTWVGFNGNGQLLRVKSNAADLKQPAPVTTATFTGLTQGLLIAGAIFIGATMLSALVPNIHAYAWAVLVTIVLKIAKLLPLELETASSHLGDWFVTGLVPPLLIALSTTKITIADVIAVLGDGQFVFLIVAAVVISGLAAGLFGLLVKMYFIDSAIVPGLIMADTGGSGDLAVLSASERMNLLPFATIATRFGGTLTLLLVSLLTPLLAATLL